MLSSQGADSVPILMTTAPAICANSGASSVACTMAGDAPIASSTLAAKFMETKLVRHCTSGASRRTAAYRSCDARARAALSERESAMRKGDQGDLRMVWLAAALVKPGAEPFAGAAAPLRRPRLLARQGVAVGRPLQAQVFAQCGALVFGAEQAAAAQFG
ncbi:hypothetical protein G6F22_020416 [Rhizopus arrhizus]|nr:hypothetical protein G6F22_020416 [Rhizopus arrhizus]